MTSGQIAIVGWGNVLQQDEGVGIQVIQRLSRGTLPPRVVLVEAGSSVIDVMPLFRAYQGIVVVAALALADVPGTIYRFSGEEVASMPQVPFPAWESGFSRAIDLARRTGQLPLVSILGIVPETISAGARLSEPVERRLPELMRLALAEAGRLARASQAAKSA